MHGTSPALTRVATAPFNWACPRCGGHVGDDGQALQCAPCGAIYPCQAGIWRCLPGPREQHFAAFLREYQAVRAGEGWGSPAAAYFRALPWVAADDPRRDIWRLRTRNFHTLVEQVVRPLERALNRPLKILDLGAGNCWLAYRLAQRGHAVAAVDLSTDPLDGLGAHVWYGENQPAFRPVQAEFDHLPFASDQMDLVVFNASLHYSTDYAVTLREASRVLRCTGRLVVMDSPVYRDAASGARMVREREARFDQLYGFRSGTLPCEHYLTDARLAALASALRLSWRHLAPARRWRHVPRVWWARLRGQREPAALPVIVGQRQPRDTRPRAYPAAVRSLWRRWLRWRFQLFQRRRYDHLVLERVNGTPLLVLPQVFNPKLFRTGAFLVEALDAQLIPPGSLVLDLGTGSGVGAIAAARWARRVVAVDINPAAVRCARINALLNGVEDRVEAREGDLFAAVRGQQFDVVLFNPPYFRGTPRDLLDRAWRATDVIERFAVELGRHLAPNGHALVVLSSDGEARAFLQAFAASGLVTTVVAERDLINETLTVYRVLNADR